jgi:polar amino acid transport system substrate-binding protein
MKFFKALYLATAFCSSIAFADDCKLTIGFSDYPPVTYNDSTGKTIGLDIELLDVITKKAGCSLTWEKLPWERVIQNVKSGELTLASSCSESAERRAFSNLIAYRSGGTSVFIKKQDQEKFKDVKSFADLINKTDARIGVFVGYDYGLTTAPFLTSDKYKSRFDAIPDTVIASNFLKLKSGRVDAVLLETVVGISLIKTNNLQDQLIPLPFYIEDADSLSNYILVSKAADPDGKIFEKLKAATDAVKDSIEYKAIKDKYSK